MAEFIFNIIYALLSPLLQGLAQLWANPGEKENSPFLNKREFKIKKKKQDDKKS